ncbi:MAG: UDP-N-acetylmuramoylalanine--D-glutamate ligase [Chloroflexi bacterium ADurb.Bin360]|nr:MAG: UDP-N-acetylmuramoylalanine--D-glutamate ligase [Chloroflexi bacterium ADurb.Bin360]
MVTPNDTVVILGFARQGKALARYFAEQGVSVVVSDRRSSEALAADMAELAALPIRYVLGGHPESLLDDCTLLCLSGGVSADLPLVVEAQRRGIPVSNDADEFLKNSPAPVLGITGSAGKTTTTALVGAMLREAGFQTWVGGNIGNPLIGDVARMTPADRIVMELSSFQLELMSYSPHIAAVLNITPNHLDRHKTMEAYIAAKAHIVTHQNPDDVAVLGFDEPNARGLAAQTSAQVRYFSGAAEVETGAFLRGEALILRREGQELEVCRRREIRLRGFHNVVNTLAAVVLSDAAGAPVEAMRRAIMNFTGVEHRLEIVRRWRNVLWVNDSIATAPERVLAGLTAFDEPLVLLAGGRDKDLFWETFAAEVTRRVRVLVLFGEAMSLIDAHVSRALAETTGPRKLEKIIHAATLEQAVSEAARWARPGEVVLLSPGGTSFDAFRDFAERGECFRALVNALD